MKILYRSLLQATLCVSLASGLGAQVPADPSVEPGLLPPTAIPGATNPKGKAPPQDKPTTDFKDRRFNVEIGNLNLSETAEIVRSQLTDLNIVVPPSLSQTQIGPLKLRNVTLAGFVRAIPAATDGQIEAVFDGESYLTFVASAAVPEKHSVCRILSLRQYLDGKSEEDVKKAIEDLNQVVQMARDHLEYSRNGVKVNAPKFSVHPSTKLLIVVGNPESVAIVEEVVSAVSGGSEKAAVARFGNPADPFASGFGGGGFSGQPAGEASVPRARKPSTSRTGSAPAGIPGLPSAPTLPRQ